MEDRPVNPYEGIVAEARAMIAAGNEPNWRALKARISASDGRKDRAQERALQQLDRLQAVRRARSLVDREPAPPPVPPVRPRRAAFRTRPTITGNMDVRRSGDAEAPTLSWDKAAAA